ncbi:MAG: hypothetical protein ACRDKS_08215 [Actinomycetota bacterium]
MLRSQNIDEQYDVSRPLDDQGGAMGAKDRGTSPKDKGKKAKRSLKEKRAAKKAKKGK